MQRMITDKKRKKKPKRGKEKWIEIIYTWRLQS